MIFIFFAARLKLMAKLSDFALCANMVRLRFQYLRGVGDTYSGKQFRILTSGTHGYLLGLICELCVGDMRFMKWMWWMWWSKRYLNLRLALVPWTVCA